MGIIWILIIGFIAGGIARAVVSGKDPMPWWQTIVLGVVGALVGNVIAWLIPGGETELLNPRGSGFIHSIIGAVVVLLIWRRVRRN